MCADPNNNSVFWSGGNYTFAMFVSKTTNNGTNWIRHNITGVGHTYAIAVDPANSDIVYAGGDPGIFKTTNFGTNWINVSSGITDIIMTIAIVPYTQNTLYAGTRDGVFKTTNGGVSWSNIGLSDVNCILIDPFASDTVYVGTNSGVFISTTGGGNWQAINNGLENTSVTCIAIDPSNYLYATTYGAGMYKFPLEPGIFEHNTIEQDKNILFGHANPVKDEMTIKFHIGKPGQVELVIYDVKGTVVKKLLKTTKPPGIYMQKWVGRDIRGMSVPSGIYFCRLSVNNQHYTKKFIWLR